MIWNIHKAESRNRHRLIDVHESLTESKEKPLANQPRSRCVLAGWEHSRASRSPSLPLKSPTSATFTACSQLAYTCLKRHGRSIFLSLLGTSTLPLSRPYTTQSGSPARSHTLTPCHTVLTPSLHLAIFVSPSRSRSLRFARSHRMICLY